MQVVNKKMCVIVILVLVIIESCTLFLMYKSYGNKNTNLDEVNLNISNSNMFAIMLEQEDGTYKEDTSNKWPTDGYTYNESMSGCIDINGNKLDGVLSYDSTNNIATVDTGNTSYCYLYFSIKQNAGKYLLKNPTNGLVTTSLQGGLYRYQGTDDVDNYICFGTRDKETCVNNTNRHMYRIIGIDEDNKLKLISKEIYEFEIDASICGNGISPISDFSLGEFDLWVNSYPYKALNGLIEENVYYKENFINNNLYSYMTTNGEWYNMLENTNWKYGIANYVSDDDLGNYTRDYNGEDAYSIENSFTSTVSAKIGGLYIHDYFYAYPGGNPGNASNAHSTWIYYENNDQEYSWCFTEPLGEITMTGAGFGDYYDEGSNYNFGWMIAYGGYLKTSLNEVIIRPVFYLKSDIEITGKGTIDDPFIIK